MDNQSYIIDIWFTLKVFGFIGFVIIFMWINAVIKDYCNKRDGEQAAKEREERIEEIREAIRLEKGP